MEYYFEYISSFFLIPPVTPQKTFKILFFPLQISPHLRFLCMLCTILCFMCNSPSRLRAQWLMRDLFYFFYYLFIYFWLCWVFVSVRGLSLVAASGVHSSSRCTGLSLSRPLLLQSTGSRRTGSVVVAHGLSCSAACGIFPDQGSNPCPLHWQADSQPPRHQGSPRDPLYFSQHPA